VLTEEEEYRPIVAGLQLLGLAAACWVALLVYLNPGLILILALLAPAIAAAANLVSK